MPHAKLWLELDYPGGRRKQLGKVLKCINRCFYWSRATIFHNIFFFRCFVIVNWMPSRPFLWATMIWAGHPPTCGQWAHEDASGSSNHKTNGKYILHHCNSCPVREFPFSGQGCAKYFQQCHRLLQGHVDTLEHQGRSGQEEGQHPAMCLDRICLGNVAVLLLLYPPANQNPLSWVPAHSWHSPTAHGMPCPVPHPAHAVLCSCFHSSQFPPQAAAHREKRSPLSRVGAGLLAEGLSLPRGASALFKMLHAQRHFYYLLAMDTHSPLGGVSWVKQEEGSLPASCWDGRQPEMLPQPLCMPTTLSPVTHQALPGVALLCTGWVYSSWGEQRSWVISCPFSLFLL